MSFGGVAPTTSFFRRANKFPFANCKKKHLIVRFFSRKDVARVGSPCPSGSLRCPHMSRPIFLPRLTDLKEPRDYFTSTDFELLSARTLCTRPPHGISPLQRRPKALITSSLAPLSSLYRSPPHYLGRPTSPILSHLCHTQLRLSPFHHLMAIPPSSIFQLTTLLSPPTFLPLPF